VYAKEALGKVLNHQMALGKHASSMRTMDKLAGACGGRASGRGMYWRAGASEATWVDGGRAMPRAGVLGASLAGVCSAAACRLLRRASANPRRPPAEDWVGIIPQLAPWPKLSNCVATPRALGLPFHLPSLSFPIPPPARCPCARAAIYIRLNQPHNLTKLILSRIVLLLAAADPVAAQREYERQLDAPGFATSTEAGAAEDLLATYSECRWRAGRRPGPTCSQGAGSLTCQRAHGQARRDGLTGAAGHAWG
jgi:hypothetical protein